MLDSRFACLLAVLISANVALAERTYTITAPKNVRPNIPYQVVVSVHNTPEDVTVVANLSCAAPVGGESQEVIGEVTVADRGTETIELPVGDWKQGTCVLRVEGTKGILFQRQENVGFKDKVVSVFIQSDKAIYQPGQLIQFRVLVVDANLRPYATNELEVYVNDAQGNRIKQWKNATVEKGLFTESVQLSDQPVLGDWNIFATLKNENVNKEVTVAEYVLPKFEVTVRPPAYSVYNDSDIVVSVDAKYTYGKPVKGKVMVNVTEGYCRNSWSSYCGSTPVVVRGDIDGTATVRIPVSQFNFPDYYFYGQSSLDFLATVTEELTGKQMNASAKSNIYNRKEKLDISQPSSTFKPGLRHTFTIKLQYQDGVPVSDVNDTLKVKYAYSYGEDDGQIEYEIPKNGTVQVDLYPSEDSETVRITAEYAGLSSSASARKAQSISTKYLLLSLDKDKYPNPKVGDLVNIEVNGTFYFSQLAYEVVARGKIVASGSVKFNNDTKFHTISLNLTQDMSPRARVVIYYVSSCGEVVADGLDFTVEGVFQTPVELSTSENRTKPGAPIDIIVETHPDALVGLLAIDQSVLLLKSGNDITQNQIISDLDGYESGWRPSSYDRNKRSILIWRPPSETVEALFNHAGLVFFSNGIFQKSGSSGYGGYGLLRPASSSVAFGPQMSFPSRTGPAPPGPMAFAGDSAATDNQRKDVVRKEFPETWLWDTKSAGKDGKAVLSTVVPDTITSWVISAFAMDEEHGLGLADGPAKVEVIRPFFVTLNLPYSIVRGEAVNIQAIVFNYMKEDVEAEVTLDNPDDQFELIGAQNAIDGANATSETKTVKVKAGDGANVFFLIEPKVVGHIDLKVTAIAPKAGDALSRKLLVKAEGVPQYFNKAVLIDLRNQSSQSYDVDIDIPDIAVKDSQYVEVSAIGDIMGPTVNNIDKLLRMPYGCGEQNMVNFVPNIVVADYLAKTEQLTDELKSKAVGFMESGYQRELTYKRNDGSFSSFGNRDKAGSTWLTAFVARSFHQAKPYIAIDDNVIDSALNYLSQQHEDNGTFSEHGVVHSKDLQGHSGSGVGSTAYVLLTFLENVKPEYKNLTEVTLRFLESELNDLEDTYELSIVTYALHLANSTKKDEAFKKLQKRAIVKGDRVHWAKEEEKPKGNETAEPSWWWRPPQSLDIEATSYALLTILHRGQIDESIPVMRYLVSQRNENGGFASTQDTVIGITALSGIATRVSPPPGSKVDVQLKYDGRSKSLSLDHSNALVLQREQLPKDVKHIDIEATGNGVGVVQVSWSYNLDKTKVSSFEVTQKLKKLDNDSFELIVCASYMEEGEGSNMAVMEVNLPSGYVVDNDELPTNEQIDTLKRVDTEDGGTKVVLYFDEITNAQVCPQITAYRIFAVAKIKPASIAVYDYYDNVKRAETFYSPPATTLCDICADDECLKKCK